ncbi:hypothetical protein [Nocardioides terrisoli]|uniref:hypothetical protein n=1 Tax=Nocardioides terrisoli TaxID=3388267 RepID=UPI00287BAE4D|nr:hypothetical protein [Nocardioides marmorisolisilvae]
MTASPLPTRPREGADGTVEALRARMQGMQDGVRRLPVPTPPELAGLVQLRTGGSYQVDSAALALLLLAASSRAGSWTAIVGVDDLGIEAAEEMGVDLGRTVVVPDPGDHWLEAAAALVDALPVVLLRPPTGVTARTASRLGARLRRRTSTLLVQGAWPGCEASLWVAGSRWDGVGEGSGRLRSRQVVVACRRGQAPVRHAELWLPTPPEHAETSPMSPRHVSDVTPTRQERRTG